MTSYRAPAATVPSRPLTITFASRNRMEPTARTRITLPVPMDVVEGLSVEEVAEAVFVATNAPFEVAGLAAVVRAHFVAAAEVGAFYPTLSVGDVVRMGADGAVEVASVGFTRVA